MSTYTSSLEDILHAMETYGGGFMQQLARLYRHADSINRARLEAAFADYFAKYDAMAAR